MSKTGLPKSVQIGPATYDVIIASPSALGRENPKEIESGYMGMIYHDRCLIHLVDDIGEDRRREVLLHEVMHGIFEYTKCSYDRSNDDSEDLVSRLSVALLDVLQRNPGMVNYLTKKGQANA